MPTEHSRVIGVAIPKPLDIIFDYTVPSDMTIPDPGTRIRVPFGKSEMIGICLRRTNNPAQNTLKDIYEVLDESPILSSDHLRIVIWMAAYYHHPIGEVLFSTIPSKLRKGEKLKLDEPQFWKINKLKEPPIKAYRQRALYEFIKNRDGANRTTIEAEGFRSNTLSLLRKHNFLQPEEVIPKETRPGQALTLNPEQEKAVNQITSNSNVFSTHLLDGVTGSGKTEVYLQAMKPLVESGKQILILVPEISLTPQTFNRFARRFAGTALIHSGLSPHSNFQTWIKCSKGEISCLIGTRSAIFAPLKNLGLIIVDEEHDSSYKQQEGLKYSARDVAVKRASLRNIPIVLGSATPSIESINNVSAGKYNLVSLISRANGASLPNYQVVDLRNQKLTEGFAVQAIKKIRQHLDNKNQVMIFINKRGFTRTLLCSSCGWQAKCTRCDTKTTRHINPERLICHYCGWQDKMKSKCPDCRQEKLIALGAGTQKIESSLSSLFSDIPIYRIDRDSTKNSLQFEEQLKEINTGRPCILVGTQMLSKGHHFQNLSLVVIMEADYGFSSIDFRGPEKTAQQIIQVSGRAGRGQQAGEIVLQTYQPTNPLLVNLINNGYKAFAKIEIETRKNVGFPPFRSMAIVRAEAENPSKAEQFLQAVKKTLIGYETLGPAPAIVKKISNRYRYQLMILADTRKELHSAITTLNQNIHKASNKSLKWSVDIDPVEI